MDDETYDMISPAGEEPWGMDASGEEVVVSGPIDHDLPCRHCGYNLRGMTEDRACPECGTAVGRSLLGDMLRFSDPQWVRTLSRGAAWILWSVLVGLLLGILGAVVGFVAAINSGGVGSGLLNFYIGLLSLLPSIIYLVGVCYLTAPEPAVVEQSGLPLRLLLRWTVVISTIISMLGIGLALTSPVMTGVTDLLSSIVGLVGYIALFVYARRLALRVPDYNLAKQTKTVMWGTIITLSGMILFGIMAVVLGFAGAGVGMAVLGIPICVLTVGYLVFAIWSLVLLIWYKRVSSAAALDAEQTWMSDISPQPMGGAY